MAAHFSDCNLELGGEKLAFDAPPLPVTLFVGNMSSDDDVKLVQEQTGADAEAARKALEETQGDMAEAIIRLKE